MVQFYERTINNDDLLQKGGRTNKPWPVNWTRMEIEIPDTYDAPDQIIKFINNDMECSRWGYFTYTDDDKKNSFVSDNSFLYDIAGKNIMVIGFEEEEDATMFKLMGGHEAWED